MDQLSDPHSAWSSPKQCSLWRYQEERQKKDLADEWIQNDSGKGK